MSDAKRKEYLEKKHEKLLSLLERGPMDRTSLSNELNMAKTTVYDHLHKLRSAGLVACAPENPRGRGQPKKYWRLIFWRVK